MDSGSRARGIGASGDGAVGETVSDLSQVQYVRSHAVYPQTYCIPPPGDKTIIRVLSVSPRPSACTSKNILYQGEDAYGQWPAELSTSMGNGLFFSSLWASYDSNTSARAYHGSYTAHLRASLPSHGPSASWLSRLHGPVSSGVSVQMWMRPSRAGSMDAGG